MATESVTQTTAQTDIEHGPAAFSAFDSTVFSEWAAAVGDLMASADAQSVGRRTVAADLKLTRRADLKLTREEDGHARWPPVDNTTVWRAW